MCFCIREGAPETLVIDGIYGRIGKNSVWMDVQLFTILMCLGGDLKIVWMWICLGAWGT